MRQMFLIVGLGNPGKEYSYTRHNLGFLAVEEIKRRFKFSRWQRKDRALISKGRIGSKDIVLVKPTTFMNQSGLAVKDILGKFGLLPQDLWVIHDDFDIKIGKIRIVRNRGSGGHKGVQSIIDQIKTKDFYRIRIGTKQGENIEGKRSFVLEKFSREEKKILQKSLKLTVRAIEMAIKKGPVFAMNEFNN